MSKVTEIHKGKTPKRVHYIQEWMDKYGLTQRDLIEKTGADKSTVNRWLTQGNIPSERTLDQLVLIFDLDERAALFRHPDDDWIARFYRERDAAGKQRFLKAIVEEFGLASTGTHGLQMHTPDPENFDGPAPDASAGRDRRREGKQK